MEFQAKLRHLRIAPKKVRLVIDVIRGLDVIEAKNKLQFMEKRAARPVLKLLESAIANAQNNFAHLDVKAEEGNLFIKKIVADEGPTLKRWKPRAFGRATPILKRSTHIQLVLGEKKPSKIKKNKAKKAPATEVKTVKQKEAEKQSGDQKDQSQPEKIKEQPKPKTGFGKLTRFIRRTGEK